MMTEFNQLILLLTAGWSYGEACFIFNINPNVYMPKTEYVNSENIILSK